MANRRRRQQGWQGPQFRVSCTKPEQTADGRYDLTLAVLARRGTDPINDGVVLFFVDKQRHGNPERLNPEGRASINLRVDPGKYVFEAQIEGSAICDSITVTVGEPKKKMGTTKVDKIVVVAAGSEGKHTISVCILSEQSTPIEGARVSIVDMSTGKMHQLDTDAHGMIEPRKVSFTSPSREYKVQCGGAVEELTLSGPPAIRPRIPAPRQILETEAMVLRCAPPIVRTIKGFMAGFRAARAAVRAQRRG